MADETKGEEGHCRICFEGASPGEPLLLNVCACRGSLGAVHRRCLTRWLDESVRSSGRAFSGQTPSAPPCEICNRPFVDPASGMPILPSQSVQFDSAQVVWGSLAGGGPAVEGAPYVTVVSSASMAGFGSGVADYPWASIRAAREARRQRAMAAMSPPHFWARTPLLQSIYQRRSYVQCCFIALLGISIACVTGALIYNWVQPRGSWGVSVAILNPPGSAELCRSVGDNDRSTTRHADPQSVSRWACGIEAGVLQPQCPVPDGPDGTADALVPGLNNDSYANASADVQDGWYADASSQVFIGEEGYPCGKLRVGRLVNFMSFPPCFFGRGSVCYVSLSAVDGETGICSEGACSSAGPFPWQNDGTRAAGVVSGKCVRC